MGIKKSIIMASIVLIALFLFREVVNWYGISSVMTKTDNSYLFKNGTMHLQGIFRGVNEFIIDEGEPLSVQLTNENLIGFEETFNTLKTDLKDKELKQIIIDKIEPQWHVVKDDVTAFLKIEFISVEDDRAMIRYGKMATHGNTLLKEVESLAQKTQEIAKATSKRTINITIIVASVMLIMLASLLVYLYRSITSPIDELGEITEGFENGDLSISMNDSRKDEFGILASHFNKAVTKLSNMISKVKKVAGTLHINSEKVSESSLQISQNAQEQSNQTTETATAIEELSASFNEVAKNAMNAAESSKDASKLAHKGGDVVEKTIKGMDEISASVHDSTQIIEGLGSRSEEIGDIIKVINDIAGQTNLLALNAAIEAARAGEQGRGFAVVADEVRKLAERTTSATGDIGDMIKGIQGDTNKAIESMHVGTAKVTEGVNFANQAGETLQQIVASVQSVTDMIEHIAVAAEEQTTTTDEISATIELVANVTQATSASAEQSTNATQELTALAQQLHQLVNEFILKNDVNNLMSNREAIEIEQETDQPIHST